MGKQLFYFKNVDDLPEGMPAGYDESESHVILIESEKEIIFEKSKLLTGYNWLSRFYQVEYRDGGYYLTLKSDNVFNGSDFFLYSLRRAIVEENRSPFYFYFPKDDLVSEIQLSTNVYEKRENLEFKVGPSSIVDKERYEKIDDVGGTYKIEIVFIDEKIDRVYYIEYNADAPK